MARLTAPESESLTQGPVFPNFDKGQDWHHKHGFVFSQMCLGLEKIILDLIHFLYIVKLAPT